MKGNADAIGAVCKAPRPPDARRTEAVAAR